MLDTIYLVVSYLHALAMVALLIKIWYTRDCTGISLKSQFLYALVFTARAVDLFTTFTVSEITFYKILYIMLSYLTLLSMTLFFWKSYEKKYDTVRIEIVIIPCIIYALIVTHLLFRSRYHYSDVLWTFSIYLESVAMIPQFTFIRKSKRIHKHIVWYTVMAALDQALYFGHWVFQFFYRTHQFDILRLSASIMQFLLYCEFFPSIFPWMFNLKNAVHPTVATVDVNVETGIPNAVDLSNKVSTIVLTPISLTEVHNDKTNLLDAEETIKKY